MGKISEYKEQLWSFSGCSMMEPGAPRVALLLIASSLLALAALSATQSSAEGPAALLQGSSFSYCPSPPAQLPAWKPHGNHLWRPPQGRCYFVI